MRRARGFTLIELMIAVAIVAIIGTIAMTGLSNVIRQQEMAAERAERWREIQFAMRVMVQDFVQIHPRLTRDEFGTSVRGSIIASPTEPFALEFSRAGWTNPTAFARGTVLRVAYDVENDLLVRFWWPVADRTLATPPGRNELLDGVVSMEMLFIDADNNESVDWPPLQNGAATRSPIERPRAVEITLELEDLGRVWRLIELSSG